MGIDQVITIINHLMHRLLIEIIIINPVENMNKDKAGGLTVVKVVDIDHVVANKVITAEEDKEVEANTAAVGMTNVVNGPGVIRIITDVISLIVGI